MDIAVLPKMTRRRGTTILVLLMLVTVAAGCSKTSSQPAPAPQVPPLAANSAPISSTAAPATAPAPMANSTLPATADSGAPTTLQSLNRAMVNWTRTNHRHPQSFEDFASTANIQIPAPPPGKKYTLNGKGFIVLVDISTQ